MKSLRKLILAVNIISIVACVCAGIALFRPDWLAELALETYQNLTSELVEVPLYVVSNKLCRMAGWVILVCCVLNAVGAMILNGVSNLKDGQVVIINGEAVSETAESVKEVSTIMKSVNKEKKHLNIFGKKKEKIVEVVNTPKEEVKKEEKQDNVSAFLKSIGGK